MLGSPIPYLKGMRILMFQLSGFCFRSSDPAASNGTPEAPKAKEKTRKYRLRGMRSAGKADGVLRWVRFRAAVLSTRSLETICHIRRVYYGSSHLKWSSK